MRAFRTISLLFLSSLIVSCAGNQLLIESTPSGAEVRVNNLPQGATPVEMKALESGTYAIQLSKPGFAEWNSEIWVMGAQRVAVNLQPEKTVEVVRAATVMSSTTPPPAVIETRLSVFTDPAGASVTIDGVFRGAGNPDEPLTVSYGARPTMAAIKVEKANHQSWEDQVRLEPERDNRVFVKLSPLPEWYEFLSDARFLRKVVEEAAAQAPGIPALKRTGSVAIVSMDRQVPSDDPLNSLIVDALTQSLTLAGFTAAERDDRLLVQLAHTTAGDSLPYRILTSHGGPGQPFLYDAELAAWKRGEAVETSTTLSQVETERQTPSPYARTDNPELVKSVETSRTSAVTVERVEDRAALVGHIPTADQLFAYRLLECGISKTPVRSGEPRPEPMIFRLGRVRLHVRAIDAKKGTTIWAGILNAEDVDEVPARLAESLVNPPSEFRNESLPARASSARSSSIAFPSSIESSPVAR